MHNAEEIAYWNDEPGVRWAVSYERIDRAFAPLSLAGLAVAAAVPGEAVLDIGCGTGVTSLALAASVAEAGSVTSVDISRPMLTVAEERARALAYGNVRFVLADAAAHAFEERAYDLIFSRFGVMFFDDPAGAFTNIRPSLRPGGRLIFMCWRDLAANPWFQVPAGAVRPHVPAQPKAGADEPGPLAFAEPERVRGILRRAGFRDVTLTAVDADLPFGSRAAACELLSTIGPASRLLDGANERELEAGRRALDGALGAYETDGEVRLGAGVWIVSAS
jgi:SAM-dependent methyltransferase